LVCEYVTSNNIKTPFHNNRPGKDWCYNFMKRHNELSFKKPKQLKSYVKMLETHMLFMTFTKILIQLL